MKYSPKIIDAIGNTPLVRLNRVVDDLKPLFLAKVESCNPGGSIKDRIGASMLAAAEREGKIGPGGTVVEATAGNTGVGLVMAAAAQGYRCIFVMPDKMSRDKIDLLRAYGAEVVITPTAVPPDSPESYNGVAERLAREIPGAFRPHQFGNPVNPQTHYATTGREIWEDTDGKVDVFVAGMGTGGTISGVGRYLKEQNPSVTIVGADPEGSILSGGSPRSYKVEGIGDDFIPSTLDLEVVDYFVRIGDRESFATARRLAIEEGLLVGGSSGCALAGGLRFARALGLGDDKVVVVMMPDTGRNYLSSSHNTDWLQRNGFGGDGLPDEVPVLPNPRAQRPGGDLK